MSKRKNSIKTGKSTKQIKLGSSISQHFQLIFILLFVGLSTYYTAISNEFFLKWAEEFSLFISTTYYFTQCMNSAGGFLTYAGTFLTQFFYYPVIGSFIFIAILFVIQYLSVIAFRIPKNYYPISFIPSLMLLLSITQLGYIWLILKSPGYLFSNSIGVAVFLLLFIAYRSLSNLNLRIAALLLILVGGYPLFGFYALFTGLICILYEFILYTEDRKLSRIIPIATALGLILSVPQLYFYFVYWDMQLVDIYIAGLPHFEFNSNELPLWFPFMVLFVLFCYLLFPKQDKVKSQNKTIFASSVAFLSAIVFVSVMSYKDDNFTAGVRIYNAFENNNWKKVIAIAQDLREKPTDNIVKNYCIASLLAGHEVGNDPILNHDNTVKPNCVNNTASLDVLLGGMQFYYNSGEINRCYRLCMENTVKYGMRVSSLKYMVKCAIVNEEYDLARKYNSILLSSIFHKDWAIKYQYFIDNHEVTKYSYEMGLLRSIVTDKGQKQKPEFEQFDL